MEVKGKKVKLSIWVRVDGQGVCTTLRLYVPAGHRRPGALSNHHVFLLSRGTGRYFGYVLAFCTGAACELKCSNLNPVYDVSNRETFEALPRWYSELETYVSESVVKIIVGNKVDKVRRSRTLPLLLLITRVQEFSRQVPTSEGEAFARRMNSLFIETSAKTAVGVSEAFKEVAEKIIDTPELWAPAPAASQPTGGSAGGNRTRANEDFMPGNINLNSNESQSQEGCGC